MTMQFIRRRYTEGEFIELPSLVPLFVTWNQTNWLYGTHCQTLTLLFTSRFIETVSSSRSSHYLTLTSSFIRPFKELLFNDIHMPYDKPSVGWIILLINDRFDELPFDELSFWWTVVRCRRGLRVSRPSDRKCNRFLLPFLQSKARYRCLTTGELRISA